MLCDVKLVNYYSPAKTGTKNSEYMYTWPINESKSEYFWIQRYFSGCEQSIVQPPAECCFFDEDCGWFGKDSNRYGSAQAGQLWDTASRQPASDWWGVGGTGQWSIVSGPAKDSCACWECARLFTLLASLPTAGSTTPWDPSNLQRTSYYDVRWPTLSIYLGTPNMCNTRGSPCFHNAPLPIPWECQDETWMSKCPQ